MDSKRWTLVALGTLLLACNRAGTEHHESEVVAAIASDHVDEPEHPGLPRRVRLPQKVVDDAAITTAPVVEEPLETAVSLPGEIASDPDRTARISSPVAGRLEQVSFREGSPVKKGDVLAIVRVPELGNVRSAYTAATVKAKAARADAARLEALLSENLTSEQSHRDAVAQAEALEAESRSLGEQLTGLGAGVGGGSGFLLALRAPMNGTVLARDAVVGQPLSPDRALGTIADLGRVWFLARIFEKDLQSVHLLAKAEVAINAYSQKHFDGTVEYIGQQIDPAARTLTARIVLANPEGLLRIGLFGTARVSRGVASGPPRLVVARSALLEVAGKSVVFVRQADGDFDMHDVVLGSASIGKIEVVSGLRRGEQVVVTGAFSLKSAILRGTLAEED